MESIAWIILLPISALLVWHDFRSHRLPNRLVASAFGAGVLVFLVLGDSDRFLRGAISSVALTSVFLILRRVSRNGLGLGDVKLAGVVGLYLGYQSYATVALGTWVAFLSAGAWVTIGIIRGTIDMRARVAFGPFMLLGLWFAFGLSRGF